MRNKNCSLFSSPIGRAVNAVQVSVELTRIEVAIILSYRSKTFLAAFLL